MHSSAGTCQRKEPVMNEPQVAIYARVSSEQQSEAKTIESQLSELRAQLKALCLVLPPEHEFIDNGYSGSTLIRPALEQLRDVVAAGGIDRLYVHCPDRLAHEMRNEVVEELTVDQRAKTEQIEALPS